MNVVFLSCLLSFNLIGQEKGYEISVMSSVASGPGELPEVPDTVKFYKDYKAEEWAKPKEGWSAFYDRLRDIKYPAEGKRLDEECDISVHFDLDRKGRVSDVSIGYIIPMNHEGKGKCKSCEELAKKIISEMEWLPATIHDIPINTHQSISLSFDIWIKKSN